MTHHTSKTAKINFINSGPVDIIRTVYYIHGADSNNNLRLMRVKTNRSTLHTIQHITVSHAGQQWHGTQTVMQDSSYNQV